MWTGLVGARHRTVEHTWWGPRKTNKGTDSFSPDTRSFKSRDQRAGIKPGSGPDFFLTWVHLSPPGSTWVTHGVEAVQPPPVSTGQDMPQLNVREKLTQAQKESISRLLNHSEIFHSIPAPWWIKFAELSPRSIYFLFMRISAIKKRRSACYYLLPRRTDYVQVALNHECFVSHFGEKKSVHTLWR